MTISIAIDNHSQLDQFSILSTQAREIKNMKIITILLFVLGVFNNLANANEVNVFSSRHYDSDIQLYEKFTSLTGIKVNVVSGKDKALQKRIIEEGKDSKADIIYYSRCRKIRSF